jgi:hypothetical protein
MATTAVQIDPKDIATVEALEPQVQTLMETIENARPAIGRLGAAGYAGAVGVLSELANILGEGLSVGELCNVLRALEEFRHARGDQAALDYFQLCENGNLTVADAARSILGAGDEADTSTRQLDRIEALRRYAASLEVGQ